MSEAKYMSTHIEANSTLSALKQALEALESYEKSAYIKQSHPKRWANGNKAITAIKEALAQQSNEQVEPVAWMYEFYADMGHKGLAFEEQRSAHNTPLYTTPPQRTWVGLTDEETKEIQNSMVYGNHPFTKVIAAIENKLKEKNT